MRYLPYAVGAFMLAPFALWIVLWMFVFPGPKHGLDVPISVALFAPSIPLVAWFFLSNLALVSDSMGHGDGRDDRSRLALARFIEALPSIAIGFGFAGAAWLAYHGETIAFVLVPLVMGLVIGIAIHLGGLERDPLAPAPRDVTGSLRSGALRLGARLLALCYHIPLVGWLLRDALHGRPSARGFFFANLAMVWLIALTFIGYPLVIVTALVGVVLAFMTMVLMVRA
ncbi:MAG: hypothetical protein AAFX39_16650 [Pseudomonadota bacterium]